MKFKWMQLRPALFALCVLALFASAPRAADPAFAHGCVQRTPDPAQTMQTEGQSDEEVRDLINDRFLKRRPQPNSEARKPPGRSTGVRPQHPTGAGTPSPQRLRPKVTPIYKAAPYSADALQSQPELAPGDRSGSRQPAATKELVEKTIGVTVWRLRTPEPGDETRMLVHGKAGVVREEWTPVRAEAEAVVTAGERIRITVESPDAGYLYVINRERYTDGTAGDSFLIFPTLRTRGGHNRVEAGRLIEVPAQNDRPPYFHMEPSSAHQVSEELIIVVMESPFDFTVGRDPLRLPDGQVREWESRWLAHVVRLEQVGGDGTAWTESERVAGGDETRKLTQEEPLPQTIYRVKTRAGNPLLIKVPLRYRAPERRG